MCCHLKKVGAKQAEQRILMLSMDGPWGDAKILLLWISEANSLLTLMPFRYSADVKTSQPHKI